MTPEQKTLLEKQSRLRAEEYWDGCEDSAIQMEKSFETGFMAGAEAALKLPKHAECIEAIFQRVAMEKKLTASELRIKELESLNTALAKQDEGHCDELLEAFEQRDAALKEVERLNEWIDSLHSDWSTHPLTKRLETENQKLRLGIDERIYKDCVVARDAALKREEKLLKALEFYAQWKSWDWATEKVYDNTELTNIKKDSELLRYVENDGSKQENKFGGKRAREAIAENKKARGSI